MEFNRYRKVEEKHSGHNGSEQRQENMNESESAGSTVGPELKWERNELSLSVSGDFTLVCGLLFP